MKPLFALTLLICAYLAPVLLCRQHGRRGGTRYCHLLPAQLAAGKEAQPRSALFEALEVRATEESARQIAGTGDVTNPGMAWDRERAFAGMERLRAEIVTLSGLHGAQRELLQWNRERIKTGRAPAVLPPRLCREIPLGAWCPLLPATFGVAGRAAAGSTALSTTMSAGVSSAPAAENTPLNESGNGPIKDELP